MSFLYMTADSIGVESGGGKVTYHESQALKELGPCQVWGREVFSFGCPGWGIMTNEEPWLWDEIALGKCFTELKEKPKLAHFYAGTFTRTVVQAMKQSGVKVTYTAAAHDIEASKHEHSLLQIPFNYKHLTDPALWERYVGGYLAADLVICPSTHSAECMRRYGCKNIKVIPHGVDLPKEIAPLPKVFTVGCLGAVHGPDKGLIYLLQAWKQLNYKDAQLIIAGPQSQSQFVQDLCHKYGGGKIWLRGWVDNVSDFYRDISLYVQPSVTEGFGIEVLEAMAHGRVVLCSEGAGASDLFYEKHRFDPFDIDGLAYDIDARRSHGSNWWADISTTNLRIAERHTWDKIRSKYVETWKELLAC